jgi:hypothetical protein
MLFCNEARDHGNTEGTGDKRVRMPAEGLVCTSTIPSL